MDLQVESLWCCEQEKQYYMQELHDTVLQSQIIHGRHLQSLAEKVEEQPEYWVGDDLTQLIEQQEDIIYLLRHFCSQLQAPSLSHIGLQQSILNLAQEVDLYSNIELKTDIRIHHNMNEFVELQLYRIIQELIRNGMKHSGASQITLSLQVSPTHIQLYYDDNGVGIDNMQVLLSANDYHYGLKGIFYRCSVLEGSIFVEGEHKCGLSVSIQIPMQTS